MQTMRKIAEIAKFTFFDNVKRHNFLILFIYIVLVMGSGILFSALSPMEEIRVILDIGLSSIEIFVFLSCAFISVKIILEEMEERTVYLILSRPVSRSTYIIGRYIGIMSVIISYIAIMCLSLVLMLLLKGWQWNPYIFFVMFSISCKVSIVAAFSILLSLISTSSASSFISIFFIWALGHFTEELRYIYVLMTRSDMKYAFIVKFLYYILPNFSKFNYKDVFHVSGFQADILWLGTYCIAYTSILLLLAVFLFRKKEL